MHAVGCVLGCAGEGATTQEDEMTESKREQTSEERALLEACKADMEGVRQAVRQVGLSRLDALTDVLCARTDAWALQMAQEEKEEPMTEEAARQRAAFEEVPKLLRDPIARIVEKITGVPVSLDAIMSGHKRTFAPATMVVLERNVGAFEPGAVVFVQVDHRVGYGLLSEGPESGAGSIEGRELPPWQAGDHRPATREEIRGALSEFMSDPTLGMFGGLKMLGMMVACDAVALLERNDDD
jgi:hypothetical protein